MYFLEFLENCTIGWVLICEGGVGVGKRNTENAFFFEKFYRGHDLPHPRRSLYTPPVETPAPAHPNGLHTTGSRAGRARTRAGQVPGQTMQGTTHARALDTLHRSALDARQAAPGRSVRRRGAEWRCNPSIMRILIALSQAWYIDSNMNKYHKDILLFLVIANCYLSIDTQPY